jgi:integrase
MRLKIAVSVVRFRPWAPTFSRQSPPDARHIKYLKRAALNEGHRRRATARRSIPRPSSIRLLPACCRRLHGRKLMGRIAEVSMRGRISKRTVDAIKPGLRDAFLWDTEVPGFGCKVTPKGRRVYVLQFKRNGRDQRVTLGRHGVELTPELARLESVRLRGQLAAGDAPTPGRRRANGDLTIAELGTRYLDEYATQHKKPSGVAQDRRNLHNHVNPLLGGVLVRDVDRTAVERVMREIALGRTAKDEKTKRQGRRIVRGGEIVANRVHALLSKMFALAEDWKLRPPASNPCRRAKRYAEHKVERFLSSDELARLGVALSRLEEARSKPAAGDKRMTQPFAAIRLLVLTGCRVGEVLSLRWKDVDYERRSLFLKDSKTGAKAVILSQASLELLRSLPRRAASDFVFPGSHPGKPMVTLRKPWVQLCAAANLEGVRLHDLRHSFASIGAANGLSLPIIGKLLGHSQPMTTARYAHLAASPLHHAVDAIADTILRAFGDARRLQDPAS